MGKPKIRFKGYTDEWEQRKFGEITELKSASRVHKDEWTSNGVPFYRSSDVMVAINGTENEKAFISEELYEKLSKVSGKLEEGDILVTGGGSVGNPYIVPDNKPLYTKDADLLWIKNKGKFHPYFLYEFFFSPTFRNYLGSISHVGTIAHYTITQLSDTPICLPSSEEQKEVGEYFQSLDHLITLHQRKCNETKKLKKYMLQKMFPQNGEKVPEVRFSGFTDDWEQRKWVDTVDISTEMVNPTSGEYDDMPHIAPGNIESFTGRILDNVKTVKEEQLISGKFRFRPDDVVYGKINPQLGKYFYASVDGLTSADAYVFNGKNGLTQKFLFSLIQTDHFFKYSISVSKRSGMPKINRDELNAYSFLMPSEQEQEKIGGFLLQLDHLITLHQCKLYFLGGKRKFAWEQRKVLDLLVQPVTDGPHETPRLVENGIPFISVDAIVDNKIDFSRKRGDISEEYDAECCKKYKPQYHDVYVVKSGSTVGKVAIVETTDRFNIWSPLAALRCEGKTNPYYLFYLLQTRRMQAQISDKASNGTQPNLSMRELEKFDVLVTDNAEEQQRIGDYFKSLDTLITLHQCKLYFLGGKRKFAWEQRKLGEVADIIGGGTPSTSKDEYWDGDIDWYAPAEIADQIYVESSERKITEEGFNNSSAKMLPVGTVLFTSRAGIGKMAILRKESCTNQGFQSIVPHENELDSYFIFSRSEELKRYGETVGAGSTFVEVSGKQMANMDLMMPPTVEEQRQIGDYFEKIDNLITLHQQKCDELRDVKKYMLQNMFI